MWSEMKFLIGRLRSLGLSNEGAEAKEQIMNNSDVAKVWLDLWECAAHAVNYVSHSLRDAYAISVGSERVKSIKVM